MAAFEFDFCIAEFGADGLLSIAVVHAITGEATILKCSAAAALILLDEVSSRLKSRASEILQAGDDDEFP